MSNVRLRSVNDKWGGVLCLNLGVNRPENFDEIFRNLKIAATGTAHYLISVYDTGVQRFLGDCEIIENASSNGVPGFYIEQTKIRSTIAIDIYRYYFREDGFYYRSVNSVPLVVGNVQASSDI